MFVKLLLILITFVLSAKAEGVRPWKIFDEDDPLGHQYYDASYGHGGDGNHLRLSATSGDKLPILPDFGCCGSQQSAVLTWRSSGSTAWEFYLYAPGFRVTDATLFEELVLWMNGPLPIPAASLPNIALQDAAGGKTESLPLSQFCDALDEETNTWQKVTIPLTQLVSGKFNVKQFRNVIFSKSLQEDVSRTLWLDNVQLVDAHFIPPTEPPSSPEAVLAMSGDQAVNLFWSAPSHSPVLGYNVYRSLNVEDRPVRINATPITIHAFADSAVTNNATYFYEVRSINEAGESEGVPVKSSPSAFEDDEEFLEFLQATAFQYFWREANPANGLIRDRSQPFSPASIAAVGFGLTALGIGVDHSWITREQARQRALQTLRFLWHAPQGADRSGTTGFRGWFYHFLDMESGTRFSNSELSSIDTALLLLGVLYVEEFFDGSHQEEVAIRELADKLYRRVDWQFMLNGALKLSHGWYPEKGFIPSRWSGYDEASFLYLLGLGAPGEGRLRPESWDAWTSTYKWETHYGHSFIRFAPLFGHQYTACWVDLRHVTDAYLSRHGITYFENSRRATLAQRAYCIDNPGRFPGYGPNLWGLTASDGPGIGGAYGYRARGAPPPENDDGTIAPTAVGGSLPFAPDICVSALRNFYDRFRQKSWHGYGFRDAFNLKHDWWGPDVIAIDQGPILLMAENLRTRRVWTVMKKNEHLQRGLQRAGFKPLGAARTPKD